jgi:hypothetical protein
MAGPARPAGQLFESAESFVSISLELVKLQSLEATTLTATALISKMSAAVLLLLFMLIFNIGLSLWLGDVFGRLYLGFFVVAAFDFLMGCIIYFFLPDLLKKPVSTIIIAKALQ